jgi:GNAT superfamily N-acetyltransferase
MHVRRIKATDHDSVWNLHHLALKATGAHLGDGEWDDDLRRIDSVYLENGGEFLVGEFDGRLVAMGALKRTCAARAEIKRMRVHPDFQRRGLGRRMLEALETHSRSAGFRVLHLDTTDLQPAAVRLYTDRGYTCVRTEARLQFTQMYFEKML